MQDTFNIYGLVAPVFTPLDEEGEIKFDIIPKYAKYLAKENITAVLVGGTTGEFASFNTQERKSLVDAWLKVAGPLNLKVMVQVGGASLPDVIKMAQHAEKRKVDAIMTLPELYFRPKTAEHLVSYLEIVNKAAPSLPLLYYHFPMMTGVNLNVSEFFKLACMRIPNFMGLKADLHVAAELSDQLKCGKLTYIANHMLGPSALMGHDSSIATVNNIFPSLVKDIVRLTKCGEVVKAKKLQDKLNSMVNGISCYGDFVPCMKAAMELVTGIEVGPPRMPQKPLNEPLKKRVEDVLKMYKY
ncbi:N-acetylneuraminate lyase-like isoform X1 [Pieris brassicae]|uniref:N-acetylneuraminate lyase-like isoform X1 n=1 Tax=Pieris brassicae TaxID=7116 RepID=UPI001E660679|nr:N-acetylneuraminate lyase-like isoform X1 [Pieris brassicae]